MFSQNSTRNLLLSALLLLVGCITTVISTSISTSAQTAERVDIFTDDLTNQFQNWSWGTDAVVENGAWQVTINENWGALRTRASEPISGMRSVVFRAQRAVDSADVALSVNFETGDGEFADGEPIILTGEMQTFTINHDGSPIWGVAWQDNAGTGPVSFVIDEIYLQTDVDPVQTATPDPSPTASGGTGVQLSVDLAAVGEQIDPHVYGISFANTELATELDLPINRWGGNATTRYNWRESVSNKASDWYFLNVPDDEVDVNDLPDTATFNQFIQQNQQTETDTLLTIPMIGWTPSGRNDDCGFRVSIYGAQDSTEPFRPDCGNGVSGGINLKGSSPQDTSIAIDEGYTQEWMNYIEDRYGDDAARFYALDNEPMLWDSTHRDVHPEAVGYDEIRDLAYQYAPAIKQVNPQAQTLGPVVWGWTAYDYSAKDLVDGGDLFWQNPPDRNAHGGVPFLDWYLQQMAEYEQANSLRILDYLDIHYYPQAANVTLSTNVSAETQVLRLRSTRSLWDPTYVDESWIGEAIQLVPSMKQRIAQNYPNTKLAITEYNWGAEDHINGALAQADILGIFGREGVDMAMYWAAPATAAPISHAFRVYRNYDGQGRKFGDQIVDANSTNQEQVSIYATRREDGATTIVLINKSLADIEVDLAITNNSAAGNSDVAKVYQYSSQNLGAIERLTDRNVNGSIVLPQDSIQLLVLNEVDPPTPEPTSTPIPTETPESTETPVPTETPGSTATPGPIETPKPTETPILAATPEPTATAGPTVTPEPTATQIPTATPNPTATAVLEPTPASGVITGQIFVDENSNGAYDPSEELLTGVTVILIDTGTDGQTTTISAVTNSKGIYRFVNVPPAEYIVTVSIPQGYMATGTSTTPITLGGNNAEVPSFGLQVQPDIERYPVHLPFLIR